MIQLHLQLIPHPIPKCLLVSLLTVIGRRNNEEQNEHAGQVHCPNIKGIYLVICRQSCSNQEIVPEFHHGGKRLRSEGTGIILQA